MAVVTASMGVAALAVALEGYLLKPMNWFERIAFAAGALTLVHAQPATDLIGTSVLAAVLGIHVVRARRVPATEMADSGRQVEKASKEAAD